MKDTVQFNYSIDKQIIEGFLSNKTAMYAAMGEAGLLTVRPVSEKPSPVPPSAIYRRQTDIVPRVIAGDTILVPVRGELARLDRIFVLNAVGEHIWDMLTGEHDVGAITESVVEAFEIDRPTAASDVAEFLADLEEAGLASTAHSDP